MANPGMSGPVGEGIRSVPSKGYLKYSRSKLTPGSANEGSCSKAFVFCCCGEEMSFLPLKLSLTCICTGLLLSLPIRNHTLLFCSSSCSNNPYSLTTCTSQNHPYPAFKYSLCLFQTSSPAIFCCPCPTPSSSFSLDGMTCLCPGLLSSHCVQQPCCQLSHICCFPTQLRPHPLPSSRLFMAPSPHCSVFGSLTGGSNILIYPLL